MSSLEGDQRAKVADLLQQLLAAGADVRLIEPGAGAAAIEPSKLGKATRVALAEVASSATTLDVWVAWTKSF